MEIIRIFSYVCVPQQNGVKNPLTTLQKVCKVVIAKSNCRAARTELWAISGSAKNNVLVAYFHV
jgi:hypothetical protein